MLKKFSLVNKISKQPSLIFLDGRQEKKASILELAAFEMLMKVKKRNKFL
tara:strand:+ start:130 stop:279 length:150 start_codon:yes stop_codon:yes gene_type:complete